MKERIDEWRSERRDVYAGLQLQTKMMEDRYGVVREDSPFSSIILKVDGNPLHRKTHRCLRHIRRVYLSDVTQTCERPPGRLFESRVLSQTTQSLQWQHHSFSATKPNVNRAPFLGHRSSPPRHRLQHKPTPYTRIATC